MTAQKENTKSSLGVNLHPIAGAIFSVLLWRCHKEATSLHLQQTCSCPEVEGIRCLHHGNRGQLLHISLLAVRRSLHLCVRLQSDKPEKSVWLGRSVEGIWSPSWASRGHNSLVTRTCFCFRAVRHCHYLITAFQYDVQPQH